MKLHPDDAGEAFARVPEPLQRYVASVHLSFDADDAQQLLDRMRDLSVLVVGDVILDDYHFCRTLGTSSKDPALALLHGSSEMFAGGALAVANHLANLAGNVTLLSVLGREPELRAFAEEKLDRAIERRFVVRPNAPTTVKRRFVDEYFSNKLFEVYFMDDAPLEHALEGELVAHVERAIPSVDLVVAADFGHGALSPRLRGILSEAAPFLAVNTQANAGNRGFHTIGCYARADYASLSEGEMRLEHRDTRGPLEPMMRATAERLRTRLLTVTRGQNGCIVRAAGGRSANVPSFAPKVVDRVGAGDALFSITSLAARLEAPPELVGFLGNAVGALAVQVLGNKRSIGRAEIEALVTASLAERD